MPLSGISKEITIEDFIRALQAIGAKDIEINGEPLLEKDEQ